MAKLIDVLGSLSLNKYLSLDRINSTANMKFIYIGLQLKNNIRNQWLKYENKFKIHEMDKTCNLSKIDVYNWNDVHKHLYNTPTFHQFFSVLCKNKFKNLPQGISYNFQIDSNLLQYFQSDETLKSINFKSSPTEILSVSYFMNKSSANEYFYHEQRAKKIWWMKHSVHPENITFDHKIDSDGSNIVEIVVKNKYCDILLEKIQLQTQFDYIKFNCSESNHQPQLSAIKSDVFLDLATLGILLDAFEPQNHYLYLSKILAPYKCAIICVSNNRENEQLQMFIKYIELKLKSCNIMLWNSNNLTYFIDDSNIEPCFKEFDQIGIPYNLIVDELSLNNGLLQLRKRDTTLLETIHISDIPKYIVKIVNS